MWGFISRLHTESLALRMLFVGLWRLGMINGRRVEEMSLLLEHSRWK